MIVVFAFIALTPINSFAESVRFRARDLGIETGIYLPGQYNAITDVPGVLVGQKTVWKDPGNISQRVRSGATAILPHGGNIFRQKVPCAIYLANAFGKLAGYTQVKELGELETPILLTGTLNVPMVQRLALALRL
jgi:D-aminopeptidase